MDQAFRITAAEAATARGGDAEGPLRATAGAPATPARRVAERASQPSGHLTGHDFERSLDALLPRIHAQDVATLLSATVNAFHGVSRRLGIGLGCGLASAPRSWPMDGGLLERVLSILIADAIVDGAPGSWIRVAAQGSGHELQLIVERSGIARSGPRAARQVGPPGTAAAADRGVRRSLPELDPMLSGFLVHLHGGTLTRSDPAAEARRSIVCLPHRSADAVAAAPQVGLVSSRISDVLMRSLGLDRRSAAVAVTAPREAWIERLKRVVGGELDNEGFSVEQLAARMHCSRAQLFRRVKRATGLPPQAYIAELRLDRAAELLRAPGAKVAEIASAVGFASLSHFSRSFRQRFGLAPSLFARAGGHQASDG